MTTKAVLMEPEIDLSVGDVEAEAEFQSEFPQVKLPFQITIGGLTMDGLSISLTKALVAGRLPPDLEYQDELVSLRFDFDGFSVTLFADAILSQDASDPRAPISVFFTHPTDGHLSPLRYLINSFIAGDTVTLGQLLSTGAATTQIRSHGPVEQKSRSLLPWRFSLFALLGLLLGFAAFEMMYQRLILTQEVSPLIITQEIETLRATASGQIAQVNPGAAKGDVAYTILTNSGNLLSLRMPCDCDSQLAKGSFAGATVLSGDPVLVLHPRDAAPVAKARLSSRGLERYLAGDQAEVVFVDGAVVPVSLKMDTSAVHPTAKVEWPGQFVFPLEGTVARLRFNKLNGSVARSLKPRFDKLTSLFSQRN